MRVEGVSISATARVTGRSRNTIARWLDRASRAAARFNRHRLRDFEVRELQADELYTFIGRKRRSTWLFATIEVVSRLWASSLVGSRSSRNTAAVLDDVILRGRLVGVPLIATDGFDSYGAVIQRLLGPACVYGQVIKTRRNGRVVRDTSIASAYPRPPSRSTRPTARTGLVARDVPRASNGSERRSQGVADYEQGSAWTVSGAKAAGAAGPEPAGAPRRRGRTSAAAASSVD